MTRIIYVVYTKEYLTSRQIIGANLKKYAFLCDYSEVKIDDLIDSPMYSTPMQVVSISPCFSSFIEKYKSQFIPEKDNTLKVSMDGNICVPMNSEYVGIDNDNNLISYPEEICISVPVYLVNKSYAQVKIGIDMKDLMILQMMQGSNDGQMNPMFMMAMMDKGGNNSMIETMLMMQMMGNNQMSFPFMPNQSQKEEK